MLLRGSILGSKFYIFEKFRLSAFAGQEINAIVILDNFLSPGEFTQCKNLIFGALELHFQVQKSKCPSTFFLKISVRALHFWIWKWVFIESIYFFITDAIESESNRIFSKDKKWSPKWSPSLASDFENFSRKRQILVQILKISEAREGLHFLSLLKIRLVSLSILSGIKN